MTKRTIRSSLITLTLIGLITGGCATSKHLGSDDFVRSLADTSKSRSFWLLDDSGTAYLIVEKGGPKALRYRVEKRRILIVDLPAEYPRPYNLKTSDIKIVETEP